MFLRLTMRAPSLRPKPMLEKDRLPPRVVTLVPVDLAQASAATAAMTTPAITPALIFEELEGEEPDETGVRLMDFDVVLIIAT